MSISSAQSQKPSPLSPARIDLDRLPHVVISKSRLDELKRLALERVQSYRRITSRSELEDLAQNHLRGLIGEAAVADAYGLDLDQQIRQFGDDGYDLVLDGVRLDVKSTATRAMEIPELLVPSDQEFTADVFVLVHILGTVRNGVRCRLVGCAEAETVRDRRPRYHPGSQRNYVVEPSELSPPPWISHDGR